jgi:C2H2-type zinc finger
MAREVQIITWCDYCLAEGVNTPGSEVLGLNSGGIRVMVDLCEEHIQTLIKPAVATFDAHGRVMEKPSHSRRSAKATGPCPECGGVFSTSQSLGMHRWRKHGVPSSTRGKKQEQDS